MTKRNFDAISFLFDLVEPMLTEFDDYRIDGALKAARKQHAAASPICMEDLIEKDAADRAADPTKAALQDCTGALDMCMTQIEQMRGIFDDSDGSIADALGAAQEAIDGAREVLA